MICITLIAIGLFLSTPSNRVATDSYVDHVGTKYRDSAFYPVNYPQEILKHDEPQNNPADETHSTSGAVARRKRSKHSNGHPDVRKHQRSDLNSLTTKPLGLSEESVDKKELNHGKKVDNAPRDSASKIPELNVLYHRSPNLVGRHKVLKATCNAVVGTDGFLVWSLDSSDGHYEWTCPVAGPFAIQDGERCLEITHRSYQAYTSQGRRTAIKSEFEIMVRLSLDKANISCTSVSRSKPKDGGSNETPDQVRHVTSSGPFHVSYLPLPPNLSLTFSNDSGEGNKVVVATCRAPVGVKGCITWIIFGENWMQTIAQSMSGKTTQFMYGSTEYFGQKNKTVSITRPNASYDGEYGPILVSNLTISPLTEHIEQNVAVACYSGNRSAYKQFYPDTDELGAATLLKRRKPAKAVDQANFARVRNVMIVISVLAGLLFLSLLGAAWWKRRNAGLE